MATANNTCLNCGNKTNREKFCCTECYREYTKKRKEFCPDCGVKLTTENAYNRSGDPEKVWLDNYCKACRIRHNGEAYQRRREKIGVVPQRRRSTGDRKERICGYDNSECGTKETWVQRMTANPFFFTHTFHKPATPENIRLEAARLGV